MPIVLALVSGLFHAGWNTLAKAKGSPRGGTLAVLTFALVFALAFTWVLETPKIPLGSLPWILMAGVGETAYVYFLGRAYAAGDLALTYAVSRALALVVVWPLSALAFGTVPTILALAATALVALAMGLARRGANAGARWSVRWTCATGVSVAVYHTGYKGAVAAAATPAASFALAIGIAVPLLWLLQAREVRRDAAIALRSVWAPIAGALCAGSFVLMIVALTKADSGRILGVRNSSVGFATLFAIFMGERPSRREYVALAVLAGGIGVFALDEALR